MSWIVLLDEVGERGGEVFGKAAVSAGWEDGGGGPTLDG